MTEGTASTQSVTPLPTAVANQAGTADDDARADGGGHSTSLNLQVRQRINKYGVVIALIIVVFTLLLGFGFWRSIPFDSGASKYPIAWFIIIAAILGSVVNEPFRESEAHQSTYGWTVAYILWKSSVSIVFAFLLYLLAIGGLIGGELFPQFDATPLMQGTHWNMEAFVTKVDPTDYKDVAKILIWSFIAGYSEKFVPNLIGKIVKTSEGEDKK